jgi:hypothetical protein
LVIAGDAAGMEADWAKTVIAKRVVSKAARILFMAFPFHCKKI